MGKRRRYKKRSNFVFALVSVVVSTIALLGFSFYKFMNAPFSSASGVASLGEASVWKEDFTNILLVKLDDKIDKSSNINALAILHISNESKRYDLYKLPVDVEVEYGLNYGKGKLSEAYKVGNSDQGRGFYLLAKTILKNQAIKIDGYVALDNDGFNKLTSIIGNVDESDLSVSLRIKNYIKIPKLISSFRTVAITNLTISDVFSILGFIKNTSEGSGSVSSLNIYQVIDSQNWDDLWESKMDISSLKKEPIKVFIANASKDPKIPGLAGWGSRVIKNLGASVLDTQNSFVDFDENTIITDNKDLALVQKIAETLDINKIVFVDDIDRDSGINPQVFRTSVSVVLTGY
ncbi:hypothetical protein A2713_01635 [candidate division WWE3 bacterium RIFCSPHIGHO2_01_FULL_35_17]|uniref:Cell envelope-related transcriptional attenuator domain-containing protein n=1 Tax=candidate division WWE3 bacterium RIFCSPHIGHO2_01_FULL_35_17 TaxID=1802614 RepID=A0A1F4UPL5_UNCKA|nr:MAG: hypothetical protein A2713_01635 [candidate division WWE3 bacterium RIFCSPHIGHO2_01_FULL_35_17]